MILYEMHSNVTVALEPNFLSFLFLYAVFLIYAMNFLQSVLKLKIFIKKIPEDIITYF